MNGIFYNDFKNAYLPEIFKELYRDKIYAPYIEHLKDAVMVDVGGNIGMWSLYAQPYASKIVCVEPSQQHFDCIKQMVKFNKYDNITPVKAAISNKNGKQTLFHSSNTTMFSLSNAVSDGTGEEVETMTVKKLFEKNDITHVDFMKIDVEGAEFDIVTSPEFEEVAPMIDCIVIEWHSWTGRSPDQLATNLIDYGFDIKLLETDATVFAATRTHG